MLYPLIPLVGLSQTTCDGGAPTWIYMLYLPLLVRAKFVEWRLLKKVPAYQYGISVIEGLTLESDML